MPARLTKSQDVNTHNSFICNSQTGKRARRLSILLHSSLAQATDFQLPTMSPSHHELPHPSNPNSNLICAQHPVGSPFSLTAIMIVTLTNVSSVPPDSNTRLESRSMPSILARCLEPHKGSSNDQVKHIFLMESM